MSANPRAATAEECARLWPVVDAAQLMGSIGELHAYQAEAPWRVRVTSRGEAAILGRWREHSNVLAIRSAWCSDRHVPAFVADAREVARSRGFDRALSPLLPEPFLDGYVRAGMQVANRLVAIQGSPRVICPAGLPSGVRLRHGTFSDLAALAQIDADCFDEFWRYSEDDLVVLTRRERLMVAETAEGELIGYTLATAMRGSVSLGRLCTAPSARRRGLGRALLAETAAWAAHLGAATLTLCTQEENVASRSLYVGAGLGELDERYALAVCDA
ncbi:MAG: GNAT family N-acetyltransferase [Coriobacteriia bacterium]|nr:GNAT family N-acetyltransferase [Coriobacteriia bacterium]